MKTIRNILFRRRRVPPLLNAAGIAVWLASALGHGILIATRGSSMSPVTLLIVMLAVAASLLLASCNRTLWERPGRILAVVILLLMIHAHGHQTAESALALTIPAAVVVLAAAETLRIARTNNRSARPAPIRLVTLFRPADGAPHANSSFHFIPNLFRRPPPFSLALH